MLVVVEIEMILLALPPELSVTLDGLSETLGPLGDTVAVRLTDPTNPPRLVKDNVVLLEPPATIVLVLGFVAIEKPGEGDPKNSDIAVAPASFEVRDARFQFASMVFVRE